MSEVENTGEEVIEQQIETTPPQEETPPKDLRGQLEKNFADDRKAAEKAEKGKGKQYKSRAREAAEEEAVEEGAPQEQQEQPVAAAPEAFSKEAKAEWESVPPTVQAAILKREQDMAKGVEELKGKYTDIDKALQPHMEAIRRQGHTPAEAVNQLFAWFQALATNPDVAFPALAKSFNYQMAAPQQEQQAQQQEQPGEQPPGEVPDGVQQYINGLEQKLQEFEKAMTERYSNLENSFAQQSQAKTQEILDNWSKGKEHFPEVRQLMAQLITSGAVPLNNGQVDLDAAYDRAIWSHPEVRAKLIEAQEKEKAEEIKKKAEAEKKAQAEQAQKARKAAVSVGTGAPGAGGGITPTKGKGKSVRESIMEAQEELSGR